MNRKRANKILVVAICCALVSGILMGCSPFLDGMLEAAVSGGGGEDTSVEVSAEASGILGGAAVDYRQDGSSYAVEGSANADSFLGFLKNNPITEAISEYFTEVDDMKQYEQYGVQYEEANGLYWYNGKPVGAFYDEDNMTFVQGDYFAKGTRLVVNRDEKKNITGISEADIETMKELTGLDNSSNNPEDTAKEDGLKYYREDITVHGMSGEELAAVENSLHAKYRKQNALIELNDYIIRLDKDALMNLSAFCSSSPGKYGLRVYADYNIADEIDIAAFDTKKTEDAIFSVLRSKAHEDKKELIADIKAAVAQAYGISDKNLLVEAVEIN